MIQSLIQETIGRAYIVYNELGYGFLENIYENALCYELDSINHSYEQQYRIDVTYKGKDIGFYIPDLIIEHTLIIELKTCIEITSTHRLQLQNYLKATGIQVGLILNFGPDGMFYKKVVHP